MNPSTTGRLTCPGAEAIRGSDRAPSPFPRNEPCPGSSAVWRRATRQVRRPIRVLLVSDRPRALERYLRELGDPFFAVSAHAVYTIAEFTEALHARPYDIVVSDELADEWTGVHALEFLRERDQNMPLIVIAAPADDDAVADFMLKGASDCVDVSRLNFLPLAVALAVEDRAARDERTRVEQELQRSRALYDALMQNPTHGVCQIEADGRFVQANAALVAILGYGSRDELLRANLITDVMRDPSRTALRTAIQETDRIDALHVDWTRKDGTLLRVHLSGRQIRDDAQERPHEWELIAEDLTAQRALEEELRHLAATDPMTGLANYRRLTEVLDTEMTRAKRTGRGFAVLMLDVDRMKHINDQYGHLMGDRALRRVAHALLASCRSLDTVARYGGDEFAMVMPETGPEGAAAIERRVRDRLCGSSEEFPLSASVGVALYPRDGETIDHLLLAADQALYQMKGQDTGRMAARP